MMITNTFGESILDIENSQLDEKLRGAEASEYYKKLTDELNTPNAAALIKKLVSDSRLKRPLYSRISKIENDSLRDELVLSYIRDNDVWNNTFDGIRDQRTSMAAEISECLFIHFPSFRINSEENESLTLALFSQEGRDAIGVTYEKFLALPGIKRENNNPEMTSILSDFSEIFAKFGTMAYLNPVDKRLQSPVEKWQQKSLKNHAKIEERAAKKRNSVVSDLEPLTENGSPSSTRFPVYLTILFSLALASTLAVSWLKWLR